MIEMLEHSGFWASKFQEPFISAHICEGPGGFIQATMERLVATKTVTKGVYAMTLKPTKSNIPGWRRSIHFLKKYPQVQLEYGADDTGDILKEANQKWFSERAKGAHLFTADGGFDFSVDYTNQEQMAFSLLLASFTIGLLTLRKGGTMIIKLFDIYGSATQDLFLGAALLFDRFTIYKPATSRPCNSERYFIGVGYHGADWSLSKKLIKHLQVARNTAPALTATVAAEEDVTYAAQTQTQPQPQPQSLTPYRVAETAQPQSLTPYRVAETAQPQSLTPYRVAETAQPQSLTRLFKHTWPSYVTEMVNEQIRWQEYLQISSITDTLNLQKNDIHKYILNNICLSKEWCEKFGVKYTL
jgi:23S rRNA U2552 (ribose-2'-O)-methylase RlmE/FtsJ